MNGQHQRKVGADAELPIFGCCQLFKRSGSIESGTEARLAGLQSIEGDWQGTVGEMKRRLVVRIAVGDGGWKATFHPIDQSMQPFPIDSVVLEGQSLKLAINAINGAYEGTISADANSIAGIWQAFARGATRSYSEAMASF